MDDPPPLKEPYREGKPLTEIIPPDHRRLKLAALVVSSMIAGVALWVVGGLVVDLLRADPNVRTATTTPGYLAGKISPAILHGPDHDVVMPPATLSIINVWLQGCQDCMPAFEAMRRLEDEGGLGVDVPIYNVAYGEADPTWAMRYGVRTNLAYDLNGGSVVRPLGIGTFTTLVVDKGGTILLRDRPDRPGYRARVRAAVHAEDPRETEPREVKAPLPETLDADSVQRVVAANVSALRSRCFDSTGRQPGTVSINVMVVIGAEGRVISSSASRPTAAEAKTDAKLGKCVEDLVRTWRFPATAAGSAQTPPVTVNIPLKFVVQ